MRDNQIIPPMHQGLLIGLLLLVLGLHSAFVQAAPERQERPTPTPEATVKPQGGPSPTAEPSPPACAIEGFVFVDLNRDQNRDDGEPGLQTAIYLLPPQGESPPLATVQSDATTGYFCFTPTQAPPGSYRVRQEKVPGFEPSGGQDRVVTVTDGAVTEILFANVEVRATPTAEPSPTQEPPRPSPTIAPTFTASATPIPPSFTPSITSTPSTTPTASGTPTPSLTATITPTASTTPTRSPTSTLRALTPIATFITTTPGVLVTTTPYPGGPIDRLPDTGSGNSLMLIASVLAFIMVGAGIARRFFFGR